MIQREERVFQIFSSTQEVRKNVREPGQRFKITHQQSPVDPGVYVHVGGGVGQRVAEATCQSHHRPPRLYAVFGFAT